MNEAHILSNIQKLSRIITMLEMKWERPQTGIEASLLQMLRDIRIDLTFAYFEQTGLQLPTGYEYPGSEIE